MGSELCEAATSVDLGSCKERLHEDATSGREHVFCLGGHALPDVITGLRYVDGFVHGVLSRVSHFEGRFSLPD